MQDSASKALAKLIEDENKNKKAEEERLKKIEDKLAGLLIEHLDVSFVLTARGLPASHVYCLCYLCELCHIRPLARLLTLHGETSTPESRLRIVHIHDASHPYKPY